MAEKQMSTIQLYTNDGNMTAVTPLLDYQQMIPTKNKQYVTEDKGHVVSYGVGKYVVDADTIRTLDYNNIHAFKTQLQTTKYYPLTVLCDSQGYMYSVIPDGTFATEDYVRTSIENIISVDGEVNLSGYATIKYVDDAIADALKDYDGGAGSESVETLTLFVYCSSENVVPDKPVGGSWDKDDKGNIVINYPDGWSSLSNVDSNYPIYMSSSLQMIGGKIISDWSDPILISGVPGEPGKDGNSIEFKYTLTKNNDAPNNPNIEPDIWTDDPTGISMEYQFEWISYRKTGDSGTAWSDATLWSKWGVDGKDGKDIEYIYYRNNGEVVTNPTPTDNIYENEDYQTDGFYPEPWTTDPQGVNKEYTHEWVCSRKKINGFWGSFSDPASWAIRGQQGDNGYSIKTLYRAVDHTISGEELSSQVDSFRNNDDFSLATSNGWNTIMPTNYDSTDWVWSISAYVNIDNKIIKVKDANDNEIGWQGPILVTGKGKDATPLNYNIYVYANLTDRPNKPTITNDTNITYPIDNVWYDYPNSDLSDIESWWQCIGVVSGATNNITWGNVIPLNGKDGVAKDGKMYETRMSIATISNDSLSWPEFNATNRIPGNEWFLANKFSPETLSDDTCIVQTIALIDYSNNVDGSLIDTWCTPYRISGERGQQGPQGETGPTGSQGPIGLSGTPGIDFVIKYCRGTIKDTNNDGVEDNVLDVSDVNDFDSSGWVNNVDDIYKTIDASYPYIYCVQGRKKYERKNDSNDFEATVEWGTPFRLSGTNGLNGINGSPGDKGQMIYPAGIYSNDVIYTTDGTRAPYVFCNGYYYVLNIERWLGSEQNNKTPDQAGEQYWTKIENFEAIYADIGMFRNALVGEAVFNGNFMFSQCGTYRELDEENDDAIISIPNSTEYQYFGYDVWSEKVNALTVDYIINNNNNAFRPKMLFDFANGVGYLNDGDIVFDSSGAIKAKNLILTTDETDIQRINLIDNNTYNIYEIESFNVIINDASLSSSSAEDKNRYMFLFIGDVLTQKIPRSANIFNINLTNDTSYGKYVYFNSGMYKKTLHNVSIFDTSDPSNTIMNILNNGYNDYIDIDSSNNNTHINFNNYEYNCIYIQPHGTVHLTFTQKDNIKKTVLFGNDTYNMYDGDFTISSNDVISSSILYKNNSKLVKESVIRQKCNTDMYTVKKLIIESDPSSSENDGHITIKEDGKYILQCSPDAPDLGVTYKIMNNVEQCELFVINSSDDNDILITYNNSNNTKQMIYSDNSDIYATSLKKVQLKINSIIHTKFDSNTGEVDESFMDYYTCDVRYYNAKE